MTFAEVLKQQVKENVMKVTKKVYELQDVLALRKKLKYIPKKERGFRKKSKKKYKIINLLEQHNANA